METRTPGLELLDRILPKSIHSLGAKAEKLYRRHFVLCRWQSLVGQMIAQNVQAVGIEGKTLWLYAENPSWRNEIQMRQLEILQLVNNCAGERLVREIRFGKRQQTFSPTDISGEFGKEEDFHFEKKLRQVNLTEAELQEIRVQCENVEDEELKKHLLRLSIKHQQLAKLKKEKEWHVCKDCSALCPKKELRCSVCKGKHEAWLRQEVRKVLQDIPWASYKEVKVNVPECTTYMLNSQRASLVQIWAKEARLDQLDTLEAKRLVMLYKCLPPQCLTEDIIRKTMYDLRFDLAQSPKMEKFKPVRRRDYISSRHGKRADGSFYAEKKIGE